jgi:hypothetical protein
MTLEVSWRDNEPGSARQLRGTDSYTNQPPDVYESRASTDEFYAYIVFHEGEREPRQIPFQWQVSFSPDADGNRQPTASGWSRSMERAKATAEKAIRRELRRQANA